jgi:hypothetical protein
MEFFVVSFACLCLLFCTALVLFCRVCCRIFCVSRNELPNSLGGEKTKRPNVRFPAPRGVYVSTGTERSLLLAEAGVLEHTEQLDEADKYSQHSPDNDQLNFVFLKHGV